MITTSEIFHCTEELLLGLPLFFAPDFFFNPSDGILIFSPIKNTSLESDHLDIVTTISLVGAGATLLTLLICRVLAFADQTKDPNKSLSERRVLARIKLVNDLLLLPIIIEKALFNQSEMLDPYIMMVWSNYKLLGIVLNLRDPILNQKVEKQQGDRYSAALRLILLYFLVVGVLLYIVPGLFAPGKLFASYYLTTPSSTHSSSFDALEKFAIRLEGSQIVGLFVLFFEASNLGFFGYQTGMILMYLYLSVFLRGILDRTGICDLEVWKGNFVLHLLVLTLAWNLSDTKIERFVPLKAYPHLQERANKVDSNNVPDLKVEETPDTKTKDE